MPINHYSNVLVVDDSGTVRSLVRKILTQLEYKYIDEASDGESALEKIFEKHFDLVISDWNMEPMNGEELLKEVRANKKYAQLPFIMMTADCAIQKIVLARRAGVDSFINKPFTAEGLQTKISEINSHKQRHPVPA
jgi:two-component system, chemotaxis family, chemotaxis protein CheY